MVRQNELLGNIRINQGLSLGECQRTSAVK